MPSNDGNGPKRGRDEFEIAYYTKELGPLLQKKLLTQRLADLSDARGADARDAAAPAPAAGSPPDQTDPAD